MQKKKVRFVLDQHDYLDSYSANSLKQQFHSQEFTASWRNNKYQFYSRLFDSTGGPTHGLSQSNFDNFCVQNNCNS